MKLELFKLTPSQPSLENIIRIVTSPDWGFPRARPHAFPATPVAPNGRPFIRNSRAPREREFSNEPTEPDLDFRLEPGRGDVLEHQGQGRRWAQSALVVGCR